MVGQLFYIVTASGHPDLHKASCLPIEGVPPGVTAPIFLDEEDARRAADQLALRFGATFTVYPMEATPCEGAGVTLVYPTPAPETSS